MKQEVYYLFGDTVKKGEIEKITIRYGAGAYDKDSVEIASNIFESEDEAKAALRLRIKEKMEKLAERLNNV
jgi:hypothetical protein